MPSTSKSQQRFFGMVRAAQKGDEPASPEIAKAAKDISKSDVKDFASTPTDGLPDKVKNETYEFSQSEKDLMTALLKGRGAKASVIKQLDKIMPISADKSKKSKKEQAITKLREYIRKKIVKEMNVTGNVQGYNTPKAFGKPENEKKKGKRFAKLTGYSTINENVHKISWSYGKENDEDGYFRFFVGGGSGIDKKTLLRKYPKNEKLKQWIQDIEKDRRNLNGIGGDIKLTNTDLLNSVREALIKNYSTVNEQKSMPKLKVGERKKNGFTEVHMKKIDGKPTLVISHDGNTGNSIKGNVDPNLKGLGFPSINQLKKQYSNFKESGSPDYSYSIKFPMNNPVNEIRQISTRIKTLNESKEIKKNKIVNIKGDIATLADGRKFKIIKKTPGSPKNYVDNRDVGTYYVDYLEYGNDGRKGTIFKITKDDVESSIDPQDYHIAKPIHESLNKELVSETFAIIARIRKQTLITENRWLELKREDSPVKSKIGKGISAINRQLSEVERFLNWYGRLKQESGMSGGDFWKRTNNNIYKIKERLIKLEQQIRKFV